MPHLRDEVERYLPFVNDPERPSGVFRNGKGIRLVKRAARCNTCFYLMVDVIYLGSPIPAHMLYIMATTDDGCLKQVLHTEVVKHKQFNSVEIKDAVSSVIKEFEKEGLDRHLLAIIADEGPNNVLLSEAGFPVISDLQHLMMTLDSTMGHVGVLFQGVHRPSPGESGQHAGKCQEEDVCRDLRAGKGGI